MHAFHKAVSLGVVGRSASFVDAEECTDLPEDFTVEIASLISDLEDRTGISIS